MESPGPSRCCCSYGDGVSAGKFGLVIEVGGGVELPLLPTPVGLLDGVETPGPSCCCCSYGDGVSAGKCGLVIEVGDGVELPLLPTPVGLLDGVEAQEQVVVAVRMVMVYQLASSGWLLKWVMDH